jgi:hypothetical protein
MERSIMHSPRALVENDGESTSGKLSQGTISPTVNPNAGYAPSFVRRHELTGGIREYRADLHEERVDIGGH